MRKRVRLLRELLAIASCQNDTQPWQCTATFQSVYIVIIADNNGLSFTSFMLFVTLDYIL